MRFVTVEHLGTVTAVEEVSDEVKEEVHSLRCIS
jgi:hypothetical protein